MWRAAFLGVTTMTTTHIGTPAAGATGSPSGGVHQGQVSLPFNRSPKVIKRDSLWKPVPISQLQRITLPDSSSWEAILAPGKITLFSAEAKAGKTTMLSLLYRQMEEGGTLCCAE